MVGIFAQTLAKEAVRAVALSLTFALSFAIGLVGVVLVSVPRWVVARGLLGVLSPW